MQEMRKDWDTRLNMDSMQGSSVRTTDHQVSFRIITALLTRTYIAVNEISEIFVEQLVLSFRAEDVGSCHQPIEGALTRF